MKRFSVVVSDKRHESYAIERRILENCDADLIIADCRNEEDMIRSCREADGILLDLAPVTKKVVNQLNMCKIISRYGVGIDNINIPACTEKGIKVTNVPDYCEEDVPEYALALLLNCIRHISDRDRRVRNGEWNIKYQHTFRIKGKKLSLLGFGRIARSLVRKVKGFELSMIYVYDPYVDEEVIENYGAKKVDLHTAVKEADYLSLHLPLTDETYRIINSELLSMMKPTSILINTARGALVDDIALLEVLENKKITCAGLDVHNNEPLSQSSEFLSIENCVLTDHAAYDTEEAIFDLKTKAAENIRDFIENNELKYSLN
jgi:D-3-phosphoglycerate dehydrogenase / 2-oxoglutarate reductase